MSDQIKHLLARTSFGQFRSDDFSDLNEAVNTILTAKSNFNLPTDNTVQVKQKMKDFSRQEKKLIKRQNKEQLVFHNVDWINEMAKTKAALHEKMVFFWHNHFAVNTKSPKAAALHNNTLRKYAMGKFGDLLHAIAKDPAMLLFLNNQQNKKNAPNENFARELMELYTIGKGNYTENDIKEAARAFTGWKTNLEGEFVKVKKQHDYNSKSFMGQDGNFDGEDVIDILLEKKETAIFLTKKFYRFFVNEQLDEPIIQEWAEVYYQSGYNTGELIKTIFTSSHFYEQRNRGNKIKSPVEYLLFLMNDFGFEFTNPAASVGIQKILGQVLLDPPNVSGWRSGREWIDSSSLLYRLNLGPTLIVGNDIKVDDKKDFDANRKSVLGKRIGAGIKRDLSRWEDQSSTNYDRIVNQILFTELSSNAKKILALSLKVELNKHTVLCAKVASLPEYQMI